MIPDEQLYEMNRISVTAHLLRSIIFLMVVFKILSLAGVETTMSECMIYIYVNIVINLAVSFYKKLHIFYLKNALACCIIGIFISLFTLYIK